MTPTLAPGLAATAFGGYLTATFGRDLYFAWRSARWPKAKGRVTGWGVDAGTTQIRDEMAVVAYEYHVGGVKYSSRRIDYGGRGTGRDAGNVLARYSRGDAVTVSYDPSTPERAILETGTTFGNYGRLLFGLVILAIGVILLAS